MVSSGTCIIPNYSAHSGTSMATLCIIFRPFSRLPKTHADQADIDVQEKVQEKGTIQQGLQRIWREPKNDSSGSPEHIYTVGRTSPYSTDQYIVLYYFNNNDGGLSRADEEVPAARQGRLGLFRLYLQLYAYP
jgi:hypothetical protein